MIAQLSKTYIATSKKKTYQRLLSYFLFEGRPITTKGRFINGLVFFFFRIIKKLPGRRAIDNPIFIVGAGRSGTTLLGLLLGMHKDISFLNEPKAIWHSVNPHDDVIGSYQNGSANFRMDEKDGNEQVSRDIKKIYNTYLKLASAKGLVDKYPEMIFRIPYLLRIFPNAKFIFLHRSVYDTCLSTEQWNEDHATGKQKEENWWGVHDRKWNLMAEQLVKAQPEFSDHTEEIKKIKNDFSRSGVEWVLIMQEGINQAKKFPGHFYAVKYEELTQSPKATLEKIFQFCELDPDQKCIDFALKTVRPGKENAPVLFKENYINSAAERIMRELGY